MEVPLTEVRYPQEDKAQRLFQGFQEVTQTPLVTSS